MGACGTQSFRDESQHTFSIPAASLGAGCFLRAVPRRFSFAGGALPTGGSLEVDGGFLGDEVAGGAEGGDHTK